MSVIKFSVAILGVFVCFQNTVCAPQQKHTKVGQTQAQQSYIPVIPVEMGKMEYNATVDAVALSEAIVGLGTNDRVVVDIIPNRSQSQRLQIRQAYTKLYQKDLIDDLKADLSGNYGNVIIALMRDQYELQAKELHRALTSILSADDHVVGSILATITKPDILQLKHIYALLYNVSLQDDILQYSDGEFKSFLYKIVANPDKMRKDSEINTNLINEQIEMIPTRENDCGPLKNPKLDDVLAFSSFEHLDHLASTYQQRKNKTLTAAFKRWCSDESIVDVYTTIIDYAVDSAKFFAKEIHDAVIGLGTDDRTIIRIIVGRHEKNLDRIKNVYNVMYDTKLSSSIAKETSGYYKEILLTLIGK
ncbi:annexin-B12 [Nilaparvata lugens]|uniref:annexin-B12 n=1 Tax=Nilaparvata lugens TaxID=108931 RepID=UPI000B982AE6|nr:annexin-B12 [Nilaparvata lugens]XP_039292938.1 annexin-B12 [Nilaparvata lugens]XP_039292939.1 annexin-B12 [Nilaparvata lugens]XP_039292940.1 annexin-B12 [Nilaparvata lugens]XP_039292941.1 annexin-B12 [Nilaparvata lugens]XP_039292942.1 annexin-B12 [Nilaparvata lugens]XP_039292943.1 annexin-B12 [Nilaparvata lugens]